MGVHFDHFWVIFDHFGVILVHFGVGGGTPPGGGSFWPFWGSKSGAPRAPPWLCNFSAFFIGDFSGAFLVADLVRGSILGPGGSFLTFWGGGTPPQRGVPLRGGVPPLGGPLLGVILVPRGGSPPKRGAPNGIKGTTESILLSEGGVV